MGAEEEDPEVAAEKERRRKERGKKRYEEDYSFVNEEFFSSWQNRTNNHKSKFGENDGESTFETMFDGKNLYTDVEVTFAEAMQEGGCTREILVQREVLCSSCNGSRERSGSESMTCYSCAGEGIKEDALFHNKNRCNTCKGHGKLIKNECPTCKGQGI